MNKRHYNVFFHLHTVSSIIISVLLFVICFAGSFAFFRDDINNWQRCESADDTEKIALDIDLALDSISTKYSLYGRDISFAHPHTEENVNINLSASKDSLATETDKKGGYFYLHTKTLQGGDYYQTYALGEFLYRLHFFAQIPYPVGYYLSGFTAFFFLFAIITGILVHWKKIIPNFYQFRPKEKLKTLWTDAHTALGTIGLPFQFVYAVTGAFFMIKLVLVAPTVFTFYNGDQNKLYKDLGYNQEPAAFTNKRLENTPDINPFINRAQSTWDGFEVTNLTIQNYGDQNMQVITEGRLRRKDQFSSHGSVTFQASTGDIITQKDPETETTYLDSVKDLLYRLHFGDYGGYSLRVISFILGIITCFVILSGVLIWLTARNKKNIPEYKRRFNTWLGHIYLAICMTMYPITAMSFIAVKIWGEGLSFIYSFYFIGWLVLTLFFIGLRNDFITTKYNLMPGSIIGLCIPIINGLTTGNWFWNTLQNELYSVFFIDIFWIATATITWFAAMSMKPKKHIPQPSQTIEG